MQLDNVFQFHKGAIRTPLPTCVLKQIDTFQFHKGAIRTKAGNDRDVTFGGFNSIKVRLELKFLSPLSRLRISFNSIKVRLEQTATDATDATIAFQFHKGAIRTAYISYCTSRLPVSIP